MCGRARDYYRGQGKTAACITCMKGASKAMAVAFEHGGSHGGEQGKGGGLSAAGSEGPGKSGHQYRSDGGEAGTGERSIRIAFGRFPVPAVPTSLLRCPVCKSTATDVRHCPPMFVSPPQSKTEQQEAYLRWRSIPREYRSPRTIVEYEALTGINRRTLFRWSAQENEERGADGARKMLTGTRKKRTPEQIAYLQWRATPEKERVPRTHVEYARASGIEERTLYRWNRALKKQLNFDYRKPPDPVRVEESCVISCFSCGRDYLQFERGTKQWRKMPVRTCDGEIIRDW